MDILKRSLAPITETAWNEIDQEAARTLKGNLAARTVVDFSGPCGWEKAAVNLGTLKEGQKELIKGVNWGIRQVQPLVELRVPFSLNIWDLDNLDRGSQAPDLEPVDEAARKIALFEETALFHGLADLEIPGICQAAGKPVNLPKDPAKMLPAFEQGLLTLQQAGVNGPYQLVLGTDAYQAVMAGDDKSYPLSRRIKELVGSDIKWSPVLEAGVIISRRGGDYVFTSGQDHTIGYHSHTTKTVNLFLTESFTFQVLEPAAAAGFTWKG